MFAPKLHLHRFALLASSLLFSGAVHAQVISPGQVGDTLKKAPELKMPESAPEIRSAQPAPAPEAASAKKITVSSFAFTGNTIFSSNELAGLVSSYTHRPVTLLEIYQAADVVTDYYAQHGYTLASVSVPAQKISGGVVTLEVLEGRISKISVEGNNSYAADHLGDYLGEVRNGTIYRGDALDEGLRRLNHLPGLKAKAIIKPGEAYGSSDIVIKSTEDRVNGSLNVDNYGRKDIGEFRFSGFLQVNNPLGVEDQWQLLAMRSSQGLLTYFYTAYSLPVTMNGTRLDLSYGRARFNVDGAPVDGANNNGKIMLESLFIDTRKDILSGTAGFTRTYANSDFSGAPLNATSITTFEIGGSYNHTYDNQAVTQISTTIDTNFSKQSEAELKAAALSGKTLSGNQRLRWEVDIQHLQPLFAHLGLLARVNSVYSPDPLGDPQKYSLGGPQSVRGFPASEVRGDRGVLGSLTLMRPFNIGSFNMVGRAFVDSGKVWNIDSPADTSLSSAGLGWDGQYNRIGMKVDWSYPLDNHNASDARNSGRVFGSLNVAF